MSSEERKQILQMVEDGKITAEEALSLIKELEDSVEAESEVFEAGPGSGFENEAGFSSHDSAPELERTAAQARRCGKSRYGSVWPSRS